MRLLFSHFWVLCLIAELHCELTFADPSIEKQFGHSKIKHFMAPVGLLPYGRNRTFKLLSVNNTDCESLKIPMFEMDSDSKLAVLVDSNNCNFSQLAKKTEKAGTGILIISNNKNLNFTELNISAKDPCNANLRIPVLVVSDETAQKLRNLTSKMQTEILMIFKVEIQKSDFAKLSVNLKMDDSGIFELFQELSETVEKFGDSLQVEFSLFKREKVDEEFARIQMILNCLNQITALRILHLFRQLCFNQSETFACFMDLGKRLEDDHQNKLIGCSKNNDYTKIEPKMNILTQFSSSFVLINQSLFMGPFKMDYLAQAICGAFVAPLDVCVLSNQNYVVDGDGSILADSPSHVFMFGIVFQILALILALCCFFVLVSIVLRKIYSRFLQKNYKEIVGNSTYTYQSVTIRDESKCRVDS